MKIKQKLDLIKNNKSIALVSPSVKDGFDYPALKDELKKLGFDKIFDLGAGIKKYRRDLKDFIKSRPGQKVFISSACPKAALYVRKSHPKLAKFLLPIDSPMAAAAKIFKQKYPNRKIFFISPCSAKGKLEAPRYKKFIEGVIESSAILTTSTVIPAPRPAKGEAPQMRGRGKAGIQVNSKFWIPDQVRDDKKKSTINKNIIFLSLRGPQNISKALKDFKNPPDGRVFVDILHCPNGCKPNIDIMDERKVI